MLLPGALPAAVNTAAAALSPGPASTATARGAATAAPPATAVSQPVEVKRPPLPRAVSAHSPESGTLCCFKCFSERKTQWYGTGQFCSLWKIGPLQKREKTPQDVTPKSHCPPPLLMYMILSR